MREEKLQRREKLIELIWWLKEEDIRSENKGSIKIFYDLISHLIIYKLLKVRGGKQHVTL